MENASKALIIAGAILLAILLISLGIMVLNQGRDIIGGSGMSKADIQTFNSTFTQYEGSQTGSEIKSLIQEVIASNSLEENQDAGRLITVIYGKTTIVQGSKSEDDSSTTSTSSSTKVDTSDIKNTSRYKVEFEYEKGIVSKITINND